MTAREREREACLRRERARAEAPLTLEDLLPSNVFGPGRRRHVTSEYGFREGEAGADEGGVCGDAGAELDSRPPLESVRRRGVRGSVSSAEIVMEEGGGEGDGEADRVDDEEEETEGGGQSEEDPSETSRLAQEVLEMLPSQKLKALWLRERHAILGDGDGSESDVDGRFDSFGRRRWGGERRGEMEPSAIPTLRQAKARGKVAEADRKEIALLRRRIMWEFDAKEEAKHRYRVTRAEHDRELLVAAQEDYARTRAELSQLLKDAVQS